MAMRLPMLLLLLLRAEAEEQQSSGSSPDLLEPLLVAQPPDTKRVPDLRLDFGSAPAPPTELPPHPPPAPPPTEAAAAAAAAERPPAFWDLIHPQSEQAFFEEYWQARPMHVARARAAAIAHELQPTKKRIVAAEPAPQEASDLVASCSVDQLLRGSPTLQMYMRDRGTEVARPGSVPVLAEQDGVGRRSLGRGADQSPSVHAAYLGGQTVVIEAAEMWFASINRVSRALMAYFDYDFTASLHLTPRNHVAMAAQSSSADLFVLQVRGSSTWEMNVPEASGEARQPYSQHTLAAGDANAIAALDPTNADSKGTLFSASLTRGDFLFVPRGWIHSARSLEQSHSGMLIFTVESERFSVGRFLQVLLGTLAKSLEDEQKSGSAKDSIFTHTQATALVDGLVAQFVTNSINETDQDWIRAPLPLGSRAEGKGLRSLVGFTRTKLETLRDRMKATSPVCDKGTQGCAGSINTLTGNMAMLQGLVKFVYESAFGGPLTDRVTSLSSQGSQQRLWKEQAQRLLCAADAGQETANGVHDTQGLGLSAELRVVTAELDGKCKGGIGAESGGAAVEEEQALAELLEKSVNAGGAAGLVLVAELPSATDDDMERVSVAAMLLDRGCAVLTAEQAAYTTEACGDTGPSKDEL